MGLPFLLLPCHAHPSSKFWLGLVCKCHSHFTSLPSSVAHFSCPALKMTTMAMEMSNTLFNNIPPLLQAMSICCAIYIDSLHGRPLPLQFILPFIPPISIPSSFPSSFLVFGGLSQRHLSPFLHIEESSSPQLS